MRENKFKRIIPFFHQWLLLAIISCPSGGIGRRVGLKIRSRKGCRFDSGLGHQNPYRTLYSHSSVENFSSTSLSTLFQTLSSKSTFLSPCLRLNVFVILAIISSRSRPV